ncbi:hypothetical protein NMY22_g16241 [Coprinellus aureogranulatus]|nr:hypothetical protein NMY22_g16241 [Coprinellus aureogranulatus]
MLSYPLCTALCWNLISFKLAVKSQRAEKPASGPGIKSDARLEGGFRLLGASFSFATTTIPLELFTSAAILLAKEKILGHEQLAYA